MFLEVLTGLRLTPAGLGGFLNKVALTGGSLFNWQRLALAAVLLMLTNAVRKTRDLHPIVFIAASAVVGVVFRFAGA